MPYIKREEKVFPLLSELNNETDPGILNWTITSILLATEPKRYKDFNKLIGVLESCKLEFYRRAVAVYEDEKIKENGDVY